MPLCAEEPIVTRRDHTWSMLIDKPDGSCTIYIARHFIVARLRRICNDEWDIRHTLMMRRRVIGVFETSHYHVVSRVVDRRHIFGDAEKQHFRGLLSRLLRFTGVRCVTFSLMGNHFHLLLAVSEEEGRQFREVADDRAIAERLRWLHGSARADAFLERLTALRASGEGGRREADAICARYLARMYDLSVLLKELKQGFTTWFNRREGRKGTLWEERFRSVLLEGDEPALLPVAAYIDLNAVRAGLVEDPKDYPFCGYGEAVAGVRSGRESITEMLVALGLAGQNGHGESASRNEALAAYRKVLFGIGECSGSDDKMRLSPAAIARVIESGGNLTLAQLLRCRVRYFTRGVALGREQFLDAVFNAYRHLFSPRRRAGPRQMCRAEWGELRALRVPGRGIEQAGEDAA